MMMIRTDITKTAAFTGHRFIRYKDRQQLKTNLERAITGCYHSGIRHFLCGMAAGFDMLAAETLLAMKADYSDIRLTAVIPFRGQPGKFNPADKERYHFILDKADNVVCLSETYFDGCFLRRNDYMLERANRIIAYYNGEPKGGTFYTCRRAERMKLDITNLYKPHLTIQTHDYNKN